jgi:hypothetical protein
LHGSREKRNKAKDSDGDGGREWTAIGEEGGSANIDVKAIAREIARERRERAKVAKITDEIAYQQQNWNGRYGSTYLNINRIKSTS